MPCENLKILQKMNRKAFIQACLVAAMALLTACQQQKTSEELVTQMFCANDSCEYANIHFSYDFPTSGPQALLDSIRAYFQASFGETYTGDPADGQAMADFYVSSVKQEMQRNWEEMRAESDNDTDSEWWDMFMMPSEQTDVFELTWQDDTFITYDNTYYYYGSGAAHGIGATIGTSFFRKDGSTVTWSDLKDTDTEAFQALLRKGLCTYFEIENEEELEELLLLGEDENLYHLPRPTAKPCIREGGVEFIYYNYEIAPYAAGTPTFIVPIASVRPFLGERLQQAFANHDDSSDSDDFSHRGGAY